MNFAVIGNPIAHSLSPEIHQNFAQQMNITLKYTKILGQPDSFIQQVYDFFLNKGQGLNITAPFKEIAFAMADICTIRCQRAQAANTLWMEKGLLHADNTDGVGFIHDISKHQPLANQSFLILGAGGASRGILPVLDSLENVTLYLANRSYDKAQILLKDYPNVHFINRHNNYPLVDIVINATSAHFDDNNLFFPKQFFNPKSFYYDLNYNKKQDTSFVNLAKKMGCVALDGQGMLIAQAAAAFEIWHKRNPLFGLSKSNLEYFDTVLPQ